jgi:hypothetical protein
MTRIEPEGRADPRGRAAREAIQPSIIEPTTIERSRVQPAAVQPSAVAWVSWRSALVALIDRTGRVSTCRIERGREPEASYLSIVARQIGDQDRIAIFGPNPARLALERAYVDIYHRPDRLIDVERPLAPGEDELLTRLYDVSTTPNHVGSGGSRQGDRREPAGPEVRT